MNGSDRENCGKHTDVFLGSWNRKGSGKIIASQKKELEENLTMILLPYQTEPWYNELDKLMTESQLLEHTFSIDANLNYNVSQQDKHLMDAITATQRKILKAFDLTPANIKEQAKTTSNPKSGMKK